jgi:sulfate adenylyltransferase
MISPHGANELKPLYVDDNAAREALVKEAEGLPSLLISSPAATAAVMMGGGYFTPLTGYMTVADALSIADSMKLKSGLFWPVPFMNIVGSDQVTPDISSAARIALRDPNVEGNPVLAIQEIEGIEKITEDQITHITEKVFCTTEKDHPGVAAFTSQGDTVIAGPIQVLSHSYFKESFPGTYRTAVEIRQMIKDAGWEKVVAFQTRNPMHRAHEELCKMAKEAVNADGILIHMLLGKLKKGDIPADVRDASIRKMVEIYFPPNTVLITGYGFDMLYAGPREAVLHAVFRQNAGCTHLIVGRDHAGVGSYYGPFDAQKIFREEVPNDALKIEIFEGDHTAWSKKLNKVVMMSSVADHGKEDFLFLSGTKVRELLSNGEPLPPEFARPEVAKILMEYYQSEAAGS